MDTNPRSWLNKLLGAAIVIAVSAWLIRWAVATLRPLEPLLVTSAMLIAVVWIGGAIVRSRRYR